MNGRPRVGSSSPRRLYHFCKSASAQTLLGTFAFHSSVLPFCLSKLSLKFNEHDETNTIYPTLFNFWPSKSRNVLPINYFPFQKRTPYQYTRKAWRKDVFDLLMDQSFFQMDVSCLPFWKQILDNLMSFDSITFRELMSKFDVILKCFRTWNCFFYSSFVCGAYWKSEHFHI